MPPSRAGIAMLEIQQIVLKWQAFAIKDREALWAIEAIYIRVQKEEWKDSH